MGAKEAKLIRLLGDCFPLRSRYQVKSVPQLTTPSNKPPCRVVFSFLADRLRRILEDRQSEHHPAIIMRTKNIQTVACIQVLA